MIGSAEGRSLSETATSLVEIVNDRPGIHFRGLARAAGISSMGQLRHHVDRLRRGGVIVEVQEGRFKRYFLAGSHPPALRRTLARFSRPVPRRIGKLLLHRPMTRAELRRSLGCADSTLGYHLSRMGLQGDVVKTDMSDRSRYALSDPETVRLALIIQSTGLDAREAMERYDVGPSTNGSRPAAAATPTPVPVREPVRHVPNHPSGVDTRPKPETEGTDQPTDWESIRRLVRGRAKDHHHPIAIESQ